jgi:DNA-binding transcriptional LysR family regulator
MHDWCASMPTQDWNDLRYVLALSDAGSLAGAARVLGVNYSTMLRRLGALEARLGVALCDRAPAYTLTVAGEELAEAARRMQEAFDTAERRLLGRDLRLSGTLRVTTTDTLWATVLPPILAAFSKQHGDVSLELTTTTTIVNLSKRDADVAVRMDRKPPPHLVGRRICEAAYALYASPGYLKEVPAARDLKKHRWIAPDDSLAGTSIARWLASELPDVSPVFRADTLTGLAQAAHAGLGVTALPCYLGDSLAGLRRVRGPIRAMTNELWTLTHEDLRGTARVRALMDWLGGALTAERSLFAGVRPRK